MNEHVDHDTAGDDPDDLIEIADGNTVWRFERAFLTSNWTCLYGRGCKGILEREAEELQQGCCSLGAHFGDGPAGEAEAMTVAAYAAMIPPERFQFHDVASDATLDDPESGANGIFGDADRTHTRVVEHDGTTACIFLNRPGFAGGQGCALHIAATASGDSPTEWKPSVCWQLPLRIDWREIDDETESATVRRWTRADWGDHGRTMAWCCTERSEGGEAYSGGEPVVESMRDELIALAGQPVYVELRRRL
jgi:hypothetical protein